MQNIATENGSLLLIFLFKDSVEKSSPMFIHRIGFWFIIHSL